MKIVSAYIASTYDFRVVDIRVVIRRSMILKGVMRHMRRFIRLNGRNETHETIYKAKWA